MDALAGVCRLASTVALGYLLVAALVHIVALTCGSDRARLLTARLNPAPVATMVALAVLSNAPSASATTLARGNDPAAEDNSATMVMLDDGSSTTAASSASTTVLRTTTTAAPSVTTTTSPRRAPGGADTPAAPGPNPSPGPEANPVRQADPLQVVVEPGDHLWGIAERRVSLRAGGEPPESDVRQYWQALIEANHDRLAEPGNPDLILPGQVLVLPG